MFHGKWSKNCGRWEETYKSQIARSKENFDKDPVHLRKAVRSAGEKGQAGGEALFREMSS